MFPYAEDKEHALENISKLAMDVVIDDELDILENTLYCHNLDLKQKIDIEEVRGTEGRKEAVEKINHSASSVDESVDEIRSDEKENLERGHSQHKPSILLKDFVAYGI